MVIVTCPRCGKPGFISERSVYSSYHPKRYSDTIESYKDALTSVKNNPANRESVVQLVGRNASSLPKLGKLGDYIDRMQQRITGGEYFSGENKNSSYRVRSNKYLHYYIGHYDHKKYETQMIKFKNGRIRSRPNGRRWCKVRPEDMHSLKEHM